MIDKSNGVDSDRNMYKSELERLYELSNTLDGISLSHELVHRENTDTEYEIMKFINKLIGMKYDCEEPYSVCKNSNIEKDRFYKAYSEFEVLSKNMHNHYLDLMYDHYTSFLSYYIHVLKKFLFKFSKKEVLGMASSWHLNISEDVISEIYNITENDLDVELLKYDLQFEKDLVMRRLAKTKDEVLGENVIVEQCAHNYDMVVISDDSNKIYEIAHAIGMCICRIIQNKYSEDYDCRDLTNTLEIEYEKFKESGTIFGIPEITSITSRTYDADKILVLHVMHMFKKLINKFEKDAIVDYILTGVDVKDVRVHLDILRNIICGTPIKMKNIFGDLLDDMDIFGDTSAGDLFSMCRETPSVKYNGGDSEREYNQEDLEEVREALCCGGADPIFESILNFDKVYKPRNDQEYTPKNDKNETIDLFERIDYKHDGDLSDKELIEYALDVLYKLELKYDVFKECLKNEYALVTNMFDSMINNL